MRVTILMTRIISKSGNDNCGDSNEGDGDADGVPVGTWRTCQGGVGVEDGGYSVHVSQRPSHVGGWILDERGDDETVKWGSCVHLQRRLRR
jgi:hypothetical protein